MKVTGNAAFRVLLVDVEKDFVWDNRIGNEVVFKPNEYILLPDEVDGFWMKWNSKLSTYDQFQFPVPPVSCIKTDKLVEVILEKLKEKPIDSVNLSHAQYIHRHIKKLEFTISQKVVLK